MECVIKDSITGKTILYHGSIVSRVGSKILVRYKIGSHEFKMMEVDEDKVFVKLKKEEIEVKVSKKSDIIYAIESRIAEILPMLTPIKLNENGLIDKEQSKLFEEWVILKNTSKALMGA